MAQGPGRCLIRAEPRGQQTRSKGPVPVQPRPPVSAHVEPVPDPSPVTHRRPGRDPAAPLAPGAQPPRTDPSRGPALTSLRPQVPGSQLLAAPAGRWVVAPGGGAPALRLFPTCARSAGAGQGAGPGWGRTPGRVRVLEAGPSSGGGAELWGRGLARSPRPASSAAPGSHCPSSVAPVMSPPRQNPIFRRSYSLPGAVLSSPNETYNLGLKCHHPVNFQEKPLQ